MIRWIKKKISNWKLKRKERIQKEVLAILKDPTRTLNNRYMVLALHKNYLEEADYIKWEYYLRNYEKIHDVDF